MKNLETTPLECVLINETWENALDTLNMCNCCERHKIDRPTKDKKWYDRGSPNRNLNRNQVWYQKDWRMYIKYCMPCDCTCRYLAREITRVFRKYKIEKCPVREELYSKRSHSLSFNFLISMSFWDNVSFKLLTLTINSMLNFLRKSISVIGLLSPILFSNSLRHKIKLVW